jgi:hypothetical protein
MAQENPTWRVPRIQSELALLGHDVAGSTVANCTNRNRKLPSQPWRTFLENHAGDIAVIDFPVVATVRFQLLYCLIVLRHDRRPVAYYNVTAHPTARSTAQQVAEAFPYDRASRFLIRDREGIYGIDFRERVEHMRITDGACSPALRGAMRMLCLHPQHVSQCNALQRGMGACSDPFYRMCYLLFSCDVL